jgi:hypothetical protein
MASVHQLPVPPPTEDDSVLGRLTQLVRLELELGLAETRTLIRRIVLAVAIGVPAAIALIASLVVLIAAALSPLFGAPWEALLIAGGGVALLSLAALGWSAWRLTRLTWPKETLRSFEENWRWLAAQLRSRLTSNSRGA